jgi:hypothetical protein
MPNYIVTGRFLGGAVTQVIEAGDAETAAEEFSDADWTPVVNAVTAAPDDLVPGMATLTVTVTSASAEIAQRGPDRGTPRRFALRFEAVPDHFNLQNLAITNGCPLTKLCLRAPENIVTFETVLTLEGPRTLCGSVTDGHVMQDTVAYEEDFTGERP